MKKFEKASGLLCLLTCAVSIVGYGVSAYTASTYTDRSLVLDGEVLRLERELESRRDSVEAVLGQAMDIRQRTAYTGDQIVSVLNSDENYALLDPLFEEQKDNATGWNQARDLAGMPDAQWVYVSLDILLEDKVPMLWELRTLNDESLAYGAGWYNIETGKISDCSYGVFVDKIDTASTVEGNSCDFSPD